VQLVPQEKRELTPMNGAMRNHFQTQMDRLVEAMQLPEHQERNVKTAYRKLFGRAVPSAWEYYVLMVILKRCSQKFGIAEETDPNLPEFDLAEEFNREALRMLERPASD
jgi:tRNA C32,U32 (ribose-2'-O)-methylase TrmJ